MGDPLVDYLRSCCLHVLGQRPGCGFFIAPRLVVTCSHVVGRDIEIGAEVKLEQWEHGTIKPLDGATLLGNFLEDDIAFIQTVEPNLTFAALSSDVCIGHELTALGFPDGGNRQVLDQFSVVYEGQTFFIDPQGRAGAEAKFKEGQVEPGFSGGPLLNLTTCRVMGVVFATRDSRSDRGGWAIEVPIVERLLRECQQELPSLDPGWTDAEARQRDGLSLGIIQLTLEQHWAELRAMGDPLPLTPEVFLANRDAACTKLKKVFDGSILQLELETRFPEQVADFVSAYVAAMKDDTRVDAISRCLVISGVDGLNVITTLCERHVLVASFDIGETDTLGKKLLEKALRAGHAVIYGAMPGGIPNSNRVSIPIPNPKNHQIEAALKGAGYSEERARTLAQKSNGNLSTLLRFLQNLQLKPEWAQGTDAEELVIAEFLGAWREDSEEDKAVVKKLSGKSYREWIRKMREIALRKGTPLIQRDDAWKFVTRYEGWYELGPSLFNKHLDRFKEIAVSVLRERDPKFDLPPDDRFAASVYGKVLTHSSSLRNGLAESLALLGSHPQALTSCSPGKARVTAQIAVREILTDVDWVLWASLNGLLPLLAEAAPREFLDAVQNALDSDSCPFDTIFAQEGTGVTGWNYITGLLWALETLAWDAEYLTRVVLILGELTARDPGGNWANRPANSLKTILLPWWPQTCAPMNKRKVAITTLLNEFPEIAWKLLLDVLRSSHQTSSGSRKPSWRAMIPDDWSRDVTVQEYLDQLAAYAELAISIAKQDLSKLADLIDRLYDLPPCARDQILAHLRSDAVVAMQQADRLCLWTKLVNLVARLRKFACTEWQPEEVNEIATVAESIAPEDPIYRHQRLFNEDNLDLYEEKDNWEEQSRKLDDLRQKAVEEVFADGGVEAVLEFAELVQNPSRVGVCFAVIAGSDAEGMILPVLLESETESLAQFAGGFVQGKFRGCGWQWVDDIDISQWAPSQIGQLLAFFPFTPDTWERSAQLLGEDESPYWSKTNANPYEAKEGLELAVDCLVQYGRPHEALRCLKRLRQDNRPLDTQQAVRVLQAIIRSSEIAQIDVYSIIEVIKALQDDQNTNPDDLFQIEGAFLHLLDRYNGASPKLLEQRLADDPAFFCEVIRAVYRSNKEDGSVEELSEQQKNIAKNAYHLLSEWRKPPGSQKDGTYSGEALTAWLEKVKSECEASGHLESALKMVGQVLVHTPPDPDGLWLHHSAAMALNARDANDMRDGFRTELFNSRGFHRVDPDGREERKLAKKYRAQAEEVESHGYHRLADSLRNLADSYEHDADRQASLGLRIEQILP